MKVMLQAMKFYQLLMLVTIFTSACNNRSPKQPEVKPVLAPAVPTLNRTSDPVGTRCPCEWQIEARQKHLERTAEKIDAFLKSEFSLDVKIATEEVDLSQINWLPTFNRRQNNSNQRFDELKRLLSNPDYDEGIDTIAVLAAISPKHKLLRENLLKLSTNDELLFHIKRQTNRYKDFCLDYTLFLERDPALAQDIIKLHRYLKFPIHEVPMFCDEAAAALMKTDTIYFSENDYPDFNSLDVLRGHLGLKELWIADQRPGNNRKHLNISALDTALNLEKLHLMQFKLTGSQHLQSLRKLRHVEFFEVDIDHLDWIGQQENLEWVDLSDVKRLRPDAGPFDLKFLEDFSRLKGLFLFMVPLLECPENPGLPNNMYHCSNS